jgi:LmbE family N-acetylglucosaminyl deacetylase
MNFLQDSAEVFSPAGLSVSVSLALTTHLAVGAHQDDLEIMAYDGIINCFHQENKFFSGVVMTNGSGSPRDGVYKDCSDEDMQTIRKMEQKKAAIIGEYAAVALLDYPSSAVKDANNRDTVEDLLNILHTALPDIVYTHNLTDKHDTHVAVAVKTIEAIRALSIPARPSKLYGCEVWRDLDWMTDDDKETLDVSAHENLQHALLGVFDSQIAGGKRYDLASMGRRRAHATYHSSHGVDVSTGLTFAMNLTPLITDATTDIEGFVLEHIDRFSTDVTGRLKKLL